MKITLSKIEFLNALKHIKIAGNTQNVRIQYDMKTCKITFDANNESDVTRIKLEITALVYDKFTSGEVVLPIKKLFDTVNFIDDDEITLEKRDDSKIYLNNFCYPFESNLEIKLIHIKDSVNLEDCTKIILSKSELIEFFEKFLCTVSKDDIRHYLRGMFLTHEEGYLRGVGTDGHKLNVADLHKKVPSDTPKVIIPLETILTTLKILKIDKVDDDFEMIIHSEYFIIQSKKITIYSRNIDENFPDYNRMIPELNNTAIIKKSDLLSTLKHFSAFYEKNQIAMGFNISCGELNIFKGEFNKKLNIEYNSCESLIFFLNYLYLIEIIKSIKSDFIHISIPKNDKTPLIIANDLTKREYFYIILPLDSKYYEKRG